MRESNLGHLGCKLQPRHVAQRNSWLLSHCANGAVGFTNIKYNLFIYLQMISSVIFDVNMPTKLLSICGIKVINLLFVLLIHSLFIYLGT